MKKEEKLYKILLPGRKAHWGLGHWPEIGRWHRMGKLKEKIVPCVNGLHLTREPQLAEWTRRAMRTLYSRGLTWSLAFKKVEIYEVEVPKGCKRVIHGRFVDLKIVVSRARLVRKLGEPEKRRLLEEKLKSFGITI